MVASTEIVANDKAEAAQGCTSPATGQPVTPLVSHHYAEAFAAIDKNGNGELSRSEIIKACRVNPQVRELLGLPARVQQEDGSRDRFESVFQFLDADGSKSIELAEFCRLAPGFAKSEAVQRNMEALEAAPQPIEPRQGSETPLEPVPACVPLLGTTLRQCFAEVERTSESVGSCRVADVMQAVRSAGGSDVNNARVEEILGQLGDGEFVNKKQMEAAAVECDGGRPIEEGPPRGLTALLPARLRSGSVWCSGIPNPCVNRPLRLTSLSDQGVHILSWSASLCALLLIHALAHPRLSGVGQPCAAHPPHRQE